MFRSALVLTTLLLAACGAKKTEPKATASAAPAEESIAGAKIPDDAASKSFAEKLIKHDATNFKPTDAAGAGFIYRTVDFKSDNTWWAMAEMSADGETIECKEQGTWELDTAADEHTAPMTWTLTRTSCAGRPENNVLRLKVNIEKGEYRIVFR
ncbi:MAG: hypothetical protein Q8P41_23525 [Pseudomonadota bacterium]|nr:hypothetical protein [Pseudomonadota bacterium]